MSWLNRLFNVSSPKKSNPITHRGLTHRVRKRPLALEPLESRDLLAVSPFLDSAIPQPIACAPYEPPVQLEKTVLLEVNPAPAPTVEELATTFTLHSNPGAKHVIYLDFTGHTTAGTLWNTAFTNGAPIVTPAYDIDGDPTTFSSAELAEIQRAWRIVTEDFLPFDVDVTTEEPPLDRLIKSGTTDQFWGIRVVIGGSCYDWFTGAGGVAYLDSFNWSSDTPCFVFEEAGFDSEFQEAITHEVGHTLGLNHDGKGSDEYYFGHNGWCPIMGASYYQPLSQWSKGEYNGATNLEDDLAMITTKNGFGYRNDDHGDTILAATELIEVGSVYLVGGIIERNTDVDVFSFTTRTGIVDFAIYGIDERSNLDIKAELLDSTGLVIYTSNPTNSLNASIVRTVSPGEYYIRVSGDGRGDPTTNGYSNYGSLGAYTIEGTAEMRLPTPVIVGAEAESDSEIQIIWLAVEGAGRYEVQYSTSADFRADSTSTLFLTGTSANLMGLQPGTRYYVRVRAIENVAFADSRWSAVQMVKTLWPAPQTLRVILATNDSLSFSWRDVPNFAFYYIAYTPTTLGGMTVYTTSLTNSVTLTGLAANTEYHVKVQAILLTGESTAWAETDAWTLRLSLAAPLVQVVETTQNSTVLSWNDFGGHVSGYKVQYSTDEMFSPSTTKTVDTAKTILEVKELSSNVLYYFRVEAVGKGDYANSDYSPNVRTLTMRSLHPLGDPILANPQVTGLTVTLNWTAIIGQSGTEEYKAGFIVECSTSPVFANDKTRMSGVILGTTCQVEDLSPDTTYYFRVHAVGNKQFRDSNYSVRQEVRTGPGNVPPFNNLYDLTEDGKVGAADFLQFAKSFGKSGTEIENPACDFNQDRKIDAADFLLFAKAFGKTTEELEKAWNEAKANNARFVIPVGSSAVSTTGGIASVASLSSPLSPVLPLLTEEETFPTSLLVENLFAAKETVGLTGRDSLLEVSVDSLEERILDGLFTEDDFVRTMTGLHFDVGSFELLEDSLVVRL